MNGKTLKLVMLLLKLLPGDVVTKLMDSFLDIIEDGIKDTKSRIDDVMVLPILKELREMLGIPDNDKVKVVEKKDKITKAIDSLKK